MRYLKTPFISASDYYSWLDLEKPLSEDGAAGSWLWRGAQIHRPVWNFPGRPGYTLWIAWTLSVRRRFFFVRERSSSGSGWCLQGEVLLWWSLPSQVPFPASLFCNHQRWSQTCKLWKIITGLEPRYRCRVPECELANSSIYTQEGRGGLLPFWWFTMSVEKNNMRSTITICTCSPHYFKCNIANWKRNLTMVIIEAMASI